MVDVCLRQRPPRRFVVKVYETPESQTRLGKATLTPDRDAVVYKGRVFPVEENQGSRRGSYHLLNTDDASYFREE